MKKAFLIALDNFRALLHHRLLLGVMLLSFGITIFFSLVLVAQKKFISASFDQEPGKLSITGTNNMAESEQRQFREAMEGAESMSQAGLYGVSSFCGSMVALFIFATTVASEIRRGTIRVTLSKPVSRTQFLLGKYLGGVVVMLAYSVVTSAAMILFARAMHLELAPAVRYAPWLMLWKNLMLGSVAMLLSLFIHPLTAGVLAFFANTYFLSPPNPLYFVLPSYERFNVLIQIAGGSLIKAKEVALLSIYALDFIIIVLLLALWRFRSKELV